LCAELHWGEEITELALTANHHWNAREPGRWNKREIRVEIEGVCNIDLIASQMTRKARSSC
jgi:hypothetical protein